MSLSTKAVLKICSTNLKVAYYPYPFPPPTRPYFFVVVKVYC